MILDADGALLRADYTLEKAGHNWKFWLESGGGARIAANTRNPDHARALAVIMERLKSIGAQLEDALVDSKRTRDAALTENQRRVLPSEIQRPVPLAHISHIGALAIEMRGNGAAVQRLKATGGNREKRLLLVFSLPTSPSYDELLGMLQSGALSRAKAYRPANEEVSPKPPENVDVDFEAVERGLRGHNQTQNALAAFLFERGVCPYSPHASSPNFDLAWTIGSAQFVAEVKSTTALNEEKQLRLGLGQVLRYAQQLGNGTRPVLVSEQPPQDPDWVELCDSAGVLLCWPGCFERLL